MRIATKLRLNAVLVLLFLVVNAIVSIYLVRRMLEDVRQLAEVEEPLKEAVLEMEINAGETARAVLDYLRNREDRHIDKMHDSERDFEQFQKQFKRLAETENERELGRKVAELYEDFKTLGDEIVSLAKRRNDNLVVFRKDVMQIDNLIDERLQPAIDRSAPDALDKLEAALDMEINIDEAFAAIEGYILEPSPALKRKIVDSEADFNRFETQYRGTRLSAGEEKVIDEIDKNFVEAVAAGNKIVAFTDQLHKKLEKFEAELEEIDRILDDEIQVLIHEETVRAAKDAEGAGEIAIAVMLATGLLFSVSVTGLSWHLYRRIIGAVNRLSEGAEEFGRGNLDYHIDVRTKDELGALAESFNSMVGKRKRDEEKLRDSNKLLVKHAAELRESEGALEQSSTALLAANQDLEKLTDSLASSNSELQRSNKELDDFAYIASHDLKAPLRAIHNLANWIAEDAGGGLPDKSRTHLTQMRQRVERLELLLDDMLHYSRAGRVAGDLEETETGAMVNGIINMISPPEGFTIVAAEDLPSIKTHRVPLETVLRNLISNAIKHHDRTDGRIEVSARSVGEFVEFTVTDDGPGIPEKFHHRIFKMFQTLKPRDEVEGSGMGLAVVKKTVESMGGRITVESMDGGGSRFQFTWPRQSQLKKEVACV